MLMVHGMPDIDALEQIHHLGDREGMASRHGAIFDHTAAHGERTSLETLRSQPEAAHVPHQNFQQRALSPNEDEGIAADRILAQLLAHQGGQAIEALAHIGAGSSKVDALAMGEAQHGRTAAMMRPIHCGSMPVGMRRVAPVGQDTVAALLSVGGVITAAGRKTSMNPESIGWDSAGASIVRFQDLVVW
jgi:hypothetical protein